MTPAGLALGAAGSSVVLAGLSTAYFYNRLVRLRNRVREAWSGMDVQLKRRHDLVPNLVATVETYAKHERGVLDRVTRARAGAGDDGPGGVAWQEQQLSRALGGLLALVEDYPDLKADQQFLELQQELVAVEDDLQMARRYYNGTVRDFNTMVEMVPSNMVARLFRFVAADFFEIELATERQAPRLGRDASTERP
jgi:LemA protein